MNKDRIPKQVEHETTKKMPNSNTKTMMQIRTYNMVGNCGGALGRQQQMDNSGY
jgi:hypothetical protein